MADRLGPLHELAGALGIATGYRDGLQRDVAVGPETIMALCGARGQPLSSPGEAAEVLRAVRADQRAQLLPPVVVAWDGALHRIPVTLRTGETLEAEMLLDDGSLSRPDTAAGGFAEAVPSGYHRLRVHTGSRTAEATVISAPRRSWHRGAGPGWGVSAHLAALRASRSRSCGDLVDLMTLVDWVGGHGGDVVTLLPLLPTFNGPSAEPSPYSPVSRLFWSELILDLGDAHVSTGPVDLMRVGDADAEVRAALAHAPRPDPSEIDDDLARYARFRGAQAVLGRDWRRWPAAARDGRLRTDDVDEDEERFHLVAQAEVRRQLSGLEAGLARAGVRLGLDLAVGVHPDGYDAWSHPDLFAPRVSVGAPPDAAFPSGQGWGFPPMLPTASQIEGHRYFAASIAHQAALAGLLRIDHIMAMRRLYWIPDGMDKDAGTYVDYPVEELFAVLCLESHRNRCELVGEDLGTVPPEIEEALPRHGIPGMYLIEFAVAPDEPLDRPGADQVAMIDTHDTPTFAGWIAGSDIDERVRVGLLDPADARSERTRRAGVVRALADALGGDPDDPAGLLALVLTFLGESASPSVMVWLEDLWLETRPVNVPGTSSDQRQNWQRPIDRPLEEALADPVVNERIEGLARSRRSPGNRGR